MPLLRWKELSPEQEAARQSAILTAHERQAQEERDRIARVSAENAQRLRQAYVDRDQAREDARLAELARVSQREADQRERQREQAAELDRQKMAEFKAASEGVAAIRREIAVLRNEPADLTTAEGVRAAGEVEGKIKGLQAALERADARLLNAERSIGRHRAGRS